MDGDEYDVVVCGTGFSECVLGGFLTVHDKVKLLQVDKNDHYGGQTSSLNLEQLYARFGEKEEKAPEEFGRPRDWNIDLAPRFIMATGALVKILLHTSVTKYLDFRSVAANFVYAEGKVHKVPVTLKEALSSGLMGLLEKNRFRKFINAANAYSPEEGKDPDGLARMTAAKMYDAHGLAPLTRQFTGHAFALFPDDGYLEKPASEMVERVKTYAYSVSRYGNSPFIYPSYGLSGLPEGFSRLAAVHGGTFMLRTPVDEVLYDKEGKVTGIRSGEKVAKCKKLIAAPEYFIGTDKVKKVGQVAKAICILKHPLPNTADADSCQIIIPSAQIRGRKNDIYVFSVSSSQDVAAKGFWVAMVSTRVETDDPHKELIPGLALLGQIAKEFFFVTDLYEPTGDGSKDNVFITKSPDSTTHFGTMTTDIMEVYKRMTGKEIDLSPAKNDEE